MKGICIVVDFFLLSFLVCSIYIYIYCVEFRVFFFSLRFTLKLYNVKCFPLLLCFGCVHVRFHVHLFVCLFKSMPDSKICSSFVCRSFAEFANTTTTFSSQSEIVLRKCLSVRYQVDFLFYSLCTMLSIYVVWP